MELNIKLEALDFSDRTPTKPQIERMSRDMADFLQKVAGSIMATGEFSIKDQGVQLIFNAAGALLQAADSMGANTDRIAKPVGPMPPNIRA